MDANLEGLRLDLIRTAESDLANYDVMIADAQDHVTDLCRERRALQERLNKLKASRIVSIEDLAA